MNNAHPNKQNLSQFLCKIVSVEGFFFMIGNSDNNKWSMNVISK